MALGGWLATLSTRLRQEVLGIARAEAPAGDSPCPDCRSTLVVPYSNRSLGASLRVQAPSRWRLRPGLSGRWESRGYDEPQRIEVASPRTVGYLDVQRRHDQRFALGASLAWRLSAGATASLRYDSGGLWSTFTGAQTSTGGYRKQTLSAELSIDWF